MAMLLYLRTHPFSTMALCNIAGDLCYVGFAFDAEQAVSLPKLAGALFTIVAHTILLAYGDDQARHIAGERGALSRIVLALRGRAQRLLLGLPDALRRWAQVKPIGVSFSMLALNGVGLFADAVRHADPGNWASVSQLALGVFIVIGCCCFAAADFARGQRTADILTTAAPVTLTLATLASWALAATTLNPFVILSVLVFGVSNLAGYFTRIEKTARTGNA
ncbi:MAG: hypothetical protein AB7O49_05780 [Sphingomonadales bacterium]